MRAERSRCSCIRLLEILLEYFAGRVPRKHVDDLKPLGYRLHPQSLLLQELADLSEVQPIDTFFERHDRACDLARRRFREPDHRDITHLRVLEQQIFDFLRADVLALTDDDVLE